MALTRSLWFAAALSAQIGSLHAQTAAELPTLRADVTVAADIVNIGDVLENAGPAAQIAIYRAPDPGTTGTLPVINVLAALRLHKVIGVETRGLREIKVTRSGRTIATADIEGVVAQALAQKLGTPDAASLSMTFEREVQPLQVDVTRSGALLPVSVRIDPRGRFEVMLEISGDGNTAPLRLRYAGTAVETVETVVLMRGLERGETIKASDVSFERRPRAEAGSDVVPRDRAIGMQARRQLRAAVPLHNADLGKPDLVQRDQSVVLIYETAGMYLTIRGKALESGADGDVVAVMNLVSKRTLSGVVSGRAQVTIAAAPARTTPPPSTDLSANQPAASVALAAANLPINRQAE